MKVLSFIPYYNGKLDFAKRTGGKQLISRSFFGDRNFFSCGSYNPKAAFANEVKEGVKLPPLGGLCGGFLWEKELIDGHIQVDNELIENLQAGGLPSVFNRG